MHYVDIVSQPEETIPVNICLFKVNDRNTRKSCELCPEVRITTLERR